VRLGTGRSERHLRLLYTSYPHALHHLDLLQHATFRTEIATDQWREYLNQKQASLFFETSETKS
jgi:hypothetical protein